MKPLLSGLTVGQRNLWPELAGTPSEFTLYGGVAIALRFSHRFSADFDFFCRNSFDPEELYHRISYLENSDVLHLDKNTLTCSVQRGEPVKISFFGMPKFQVIAPPDVLEDSHLKIASLIDLAGTKAAVIQKRAAARDYLDLDVLLARGGVELMTALVAARRAYGRFFNPHVTLKALVFYGDGNLETVPEEVRRRLTSAVRALPLEELSARLSELDTE